LRVRVREAIAICLDEPDDSSDRPTFVGVERVTA
jgi:hypothetical protein